ncbi:hypothetical protein [Actinoplanes sp. NPDC051494]|uniref:hypothetical protein n=1 Tax=Actinoplanes sp. NPDC051494 TaxID=3363907 RepID=UPI003787EFFB
MRRSFGLVAAAIAMTGLAACGSSEPGGASGGAGDPAEAKVATLVSTAATPSASAKVKAERPRETLGMTSEESEALLAPYQKCLKENGVESGDIKAARSGTRAATEAEMSKMEKANQICEPQYFPLPPWEKDPANPESRDFAVATVKCLKEKGIEFVEVSEDGISIALGGDQNDSRSITRGMDLIPGCEREIAARTK